MSSIEDRIQRLQTEHERLRLAYEELLREVRGAEQSAGCPDGRLSRRRLLGAAGAAAVGATLAGLAGSAPAPALATDGQAVIAGQSNTDTGTTAIPGSVLAGPAMRAANFYSGAYDNYSDAFQAYTYGVGLSAIYGRNDASGGAAIEGLSANGTALYAAGSGRLRQDAYPNLAAGPPTYTPNKFEQVRDGNGVLWVSDANGGWRRLNTMIPIVPVRVMDTRSGVGGVTGPVAAGGTATVTVAGTNGIPSNAIGIVANLTAVSSTAGGYLVVYPASSGIPSTSTVNFTTGATVANLAVVGLGTGGSAGAVSVYAGMASGNVQILLDVQGYLQ